MKERNKKNYIILHNDSIRETKRPKSCNEVITVADYYGKTRNHFWVKIKTICGYSICDSRTIMELAEVLKKRKPVKESNNDKE